MIDPARIADAVAAWRAARDRGQVPDLDALCGFEPDLAHAVRAELVRQGDSAVTPKTGTLPDLGVVLQRTAADPAYRLVRRLGGGTYGSVWLADDAAIPGRQVAVKTICVPADHRDAGRQLAALRNEAALLAQVDHPNVVRLHHWWVADDADYLVLQFVPGGSLQDKLDADRRLPGDEAARHAADAAAGLAAVHAAGLVHRDVKPANLLWHPARTAVLLADFGVSCRLADAGGLKGSLAYLAPEVFDGVVAPPADVYALAATLFQLATGEFPFDTTVAVRLPTLARAGLPTPDPRLTGVPAVEVAVRAGLAADPAARPTAAAFVGLLNQSLADELAPPTSAGLRLVVSRVTPAGPQVVAATPGGGPATRDFKRVPRTPDRVTVRTGEVVRVQVTTDRPGHLTVWNVGPTGNLTELFPAAAVPAGLIDVFDAELTPPAGRERLIAVRTDERIVLRPADVAGVLGPPRGTRDLIGVRSTLSVIPPDRWTVTLLELDHTA